mmetsp:Transcript_13957/g.55730  ORF Transcript_13957/g.55730 Transcript_13957/m.55730 type:complete len:123 (+) Transcript_13957:3-371(+)
MLAVRRLVDGDLALQRHLVDNAAKVGTHFLCPKCIADYLVQAFHELRRHFGLRRVLDEDRGLLGRILNETWLRGPECVSSKDEDPILEVWYDISRKGDARLQTRPTRCRLENILNSSSSRRR